MEEVTTRAPKCECGGLWKLQYELPKYDEALIDKDEWSIFRYRAFMPLADDTWKTVTMGEGMTPIVPFGSDLLPETMPLTKNTVSYTAGRRTA